jgi:hypothetical protein
MAEIECLTCGGGIDLEKNYGGLLLDAERPFDLSVSPCGMECSDCRDKRNAEQLYRGVR